MTGLNRESDTIMSICCFVTDADMNMLDETGFDAVVHHEQAALDAMDDWCTKTHGKSGLTAACLASKTTAEEAADAMLNYIQKYVPERKEGLLAGNSVHADKEFLRKGPYSAVLNHLSYRILDVSTIKEAARRWADQSVLQKAPQKQGLHEARADILESIAEARFYRDTFFKPR